MAAQNLDEQQLGKGVDDAGAGLLGLLFLLSEQLNQQRQPGFIAGQQQPFRQGLEQQGPGV